MTDTRILTTSNPKFQPIQTTMTDAEALVALRSLSSEFAHDLIVKSRSQKFGLSAGQNYWAHKLVLDATRPKAAGVSIGSMAGIMQLFNTAKQHLNYPKIRLSLNGATVQLSLAGARASMPGTINVTDGGKYGASTFYGRIAKDGTFQGRNGVPTGLVDLLTALAGDPERVASEYGRLTGNCCFCARTLTDERSTAVGYGETCAGHYGLSWGTKTGWNQKPAVIEADGVTIWQATETGSYVAEMSDLAGEAMTCPACQQAWATPLTPVHDADDLRLLAGQCACGARVELLND